MVPSSSSELRKDINNILKEWHFGTEDMFDSDDIDEMTSDILKIVNKKRPPIENHQVKKIRVKTKQNRNSVIKEGILDS